ncbi:protein tyrosine phosphatase [Shewanella psychrophila]|uniref:protein-tyrosine-phosphatase n=1 Tax=Shewanella psychrophila TaxID=225848 RepID=A0A1S6HZ34_9GAMM|nr:protein-tyrosine phosphatase family protein [Shewanella psychrophila]AQS40714.1 protein tyrosine phosphatase [Shewanella psychrophila]
MPITVQVQKNAQLLTSYIDQITKADVSNSHTRMGVLGNKVVQTGVSKADSQTAQALLAHVRDIALTQDETRSLYAAQADGKFSLGSGNTEKDGFVLKEIKGELTVKAAGIILGAVKREQAEQADQAPAVPPRGAQLERGPQALASHPHLSSPDVSNHSLQGSQVAQMFYSEIDELGLKPTEMKSDNIAFWPSSRKPGSFGVKLPGSTLLLAAKSKEQALEKIGNGIQNHLGNDVLILSSKPNKAVNSLAIWPSSSGQGFSVKLPGVGLARTTNLEAAKAKIDDYRATTHSPQAQQTHAARNVLTTAPSSLEADRQELDSRLTNLRGNLNPKAHPDLYQQQQPGTSKLNRFGDIQSAQHTNVASDLNANRINIGGKNIAIATQYPLAHQIESHLKMLVQNRTPSLTVLTEQSKMNDPTKGMQDYFSKSAQYGSVQTKSSLVETVDFDGIHADVYKLVIREPGQKSIEVPVVHITNWEDMTAVDAEVTLKITAKIKELTDEKLSGYQSIGSRAVGDPDKLLPVVHCRAGVGRTGQILGAMAMQEPANKASLESIVTDMRTSRNGIMVQTDKQLDVLAEIANSQSRALVS